MKLTQLRINNFQSFGPETTTLTLDAMCFLLGPNGAGKTAVLQALARLFGFDPSLRRIQRTDFHVKADAADDEFAPATLWLEGQFEFPELKNPKGKHATIPGNFAHMQLPPATSRNECAAAVVRNCPHVWTAIPSMPLPSG